jgi:hypothetical protein
MSSRGSNRQSLGQAVFDRLLQDQSQLSENRSASCATRQAHDRLGTVETTRDSGTLVDLSSKCAADAVVEGLRLGESKHAHRR